MTNSQTSRSDHFVAQGFVLVLRFQCLGHARSSLLPFAGSCYCFEAATALKPRFKVWVIHAARCCRVPATATALKPRRPRSRDGLEAAMALPAQRKDRYVLIGEEADNPLASGSFGKVFSGWDRVSNMNVAIKKQEPSSTILARELAMHRSLLHNPHRNVMRMFDAFVDEK